MKNDLTIGEVFDTLYEDQKQYVYNKVGAVIEGFLSVAHSINCVLRRPDFTKKQKVVIIHILEEADK